MARNTPWKADLGKSYNYPVTNQPFAQIDYGSIIAEAPSSSVDALQCFLWEELPYVWLKTYKAMNIQPVNVHTMTISGFQYLFDHATELVTHGQLPPRDAPDDRLVAVQGRSRPVKRERPNSRMRRQPLSAVAAVEPDQRSQYDRGHFIAHSIGGDLDINIFPQMRIVNQGRSDPGKRYRKMESYCASNAGVYCFSRPIYTGLSLHPYALEFGVLKTDGTFGWRSS